MNNIGVKIKKLDDRAVVPTYGSSEAAGADLYAVLDESLEIKAGESVQVHTGISMEMPKGVVGLIYARSGLGCKKGLAPANKVGVIDSDYRGEIIVVLHNHSNETRIVENGDRVAQMVFAPYYFAEFTEVEELADTNRGEGGFGSTGKS